MRVRPRAMPESVRRAASSALITIGMGKRLPRLMAVRT